MVKPRYTQFLRRKITKDREQPVKLSIELIFRVNLIELSFRLVLDKWKFLDKESTTVNFDYAVTLGDGELEVNDGIAVARDEIDFPQAEVAHQSTQVRVSARTKTFKSANFRRQLMLIKTQYNNLESVSFWQQP